MPAPVITLLTDFGHLDPYAGIMKGVILGICPEARIVDLTHEVIPYRIAQGAFLLEESWRYFPPGTIHVAVVDPGVGTSRRPLLVEAGGHYFIGPDNGVLPEGEAFEILTDGQPASHTFHGRDVFAPAAARLAMGEKRVKPVNDPVRLTLERGTVLHIDRFGNVITNLLPGAEIRATRVTTYAEGPPGELFVIEGSSGYLEIALNQGSAAERLGIHVEDVLPVETQHVLALL